MTATMFAADYTDEWIGLREDGLTYREIGERYGFSHERVRQMISAKVSDDARVSAKHVLRKNMAGRIREWLLANGPTPRDVVLDTFGITPYLLARLLREEDLPTHLILASQSEEGMYDLTYTDDQIFDVMRRVWSDVQRTVPGATGLAHLRYDRHRRVDDPSSALIIGRFGYWNVACDAAGVPSGRGRVRDTYTSKWTDAELLACVRVYLDECMAEGRRPSYADFDQWNRGHADRPSAALVRTRMARAGVGGWLAIVQAAKEAA